MMGLVVNSFCFLVSKSIWGWDDSYLFIGNKNLVFSIHVWLFVLKISISDVISSETIRFVFLHIVIVVVAFCLCLHSQAICVFDVVNLLQQRSNHISDWECSKVLSNIVW
ncbi:hypothetical protein U1Q18_031236 [Sarracenia purpurea var. burkii]